MLLTVALKIYGFLKEMPFAVGTNIALAEMLLWQ